MVFLIADPFDKPAAAGKLRTGFPDYRDLGIRVYKYMRIYLCGAIRNEGLEQAVIQSQRAS